MDPQAYSVDKRLLSGRDIPLRHSFNSTKATIAIMAAATIFAAFDTNASPACYARCEAIRAESCSGLDEASVSICRASKEARYADCRARCQLEEGTRKTERLRR